MTMDKLGVIIKTKRIKKERLDYELVPYAYGFPIFPIPMREIEDIIKVNCRRVGLLP